MAKRKRDCQHTGQQGAFCTDCGKRLKWKSGCGAVRPASDKVCPWCGDRPTKANQRGVRV